MNIADLRKQFPTLGKFSDLEIADIYAQGEGIDRETALYELGYREPTRSTTRAIGDVATKFVGGVPKAAGALAGLGVYIPGVHHAAEPVSQGLKGAGEWIEDKLLSDYQKQKDEELARSMDREGIWDSAKGAAGYLYDNPSQVIPAIAQSIPLMYGGGLVARALGRVAPGVGLGTRAAIGEGAIIGGEVGSEIAERNPEEFGKRYYGLAAGAGGAAFGRLGSKLMGGSDVDTMIAQGLRKTIQESGGPMNLLKSVPKRVGIGMIGEGVFEEMPQESLETAMTNLGTNQPWSHGVGGAGVFGAAVGATMGGAVALRRPGNTYTHNELERAREVLADQSAPIEARLAAADWMQRIVDGNAPLDLMDQRDTALTQGADQFLEQHFANRFVEPEQSDEFQWQRPIGITKDDLLAAFNEPVGTVGERTVTAWDEHKAAHPELFGKQTQQKEKPLSKKQMEAQAIIADAVQSGATEADVQLLTRLAQEHKLGELRKTAAQLKAAQAEPASVLPPDPAVALQEKALGTQAPQTVEAKPQETQQALQVTREATGQPDIRALGEALLASVQPGRKSRVTGKNVDFGGLLRTYFGFDGTNDEKLAAVAVAHGYPNDENAKATAWSNIRKGVQRLKAAAADLGVTDAQAVAAIRALQEDRVSDLALTEDQQVIARDTGAIDTGLESPNQGKLDFTDAASHGLLHRELQANPVTDATGDAADKGASVAALAAEQALDAASTVEVATNGESTTRVAFKTTKDRKANAGKTVAEIQADRAAATQAKVDAKAANLEAPKLLFSESEYEMAEWYYSEVTERAARGGAPLTAWGSLSQHAKTLFTSELLNMAATHRGKINRGALEDAARFYEGVDDAQGVQQSVTTERGAVTETGTGRTENSVDGAGAAEPGRAKIGNGATVSQPSRETAKAQEVPASTTSQEPRGEVTAEAIAAEWNKAARALGLSSWGDVNASDKDYMLGSATWQEFDEAAGEVADELQTSRAPADELGFAEKVGAGGTATTKDSLTDQPADAPSVQPATDQNGFIAGPNGYRTRISEHKEGSNFLDPTADIGAITYEVRKGNDDNKPLSMVLRKDGKLVEVGAVLDASGNSNGMAWVPQTAVKRGQVIELLQRRATTELGSQARRDIDAKIAEIVTGKVGAGETAQLNETIEQVKEKLATRFMVGDSVRVGSIPGVVVGVDGDYIRFRPDNTEHPKGFHRVQAKTATFVSRPDTSLTSSASKSKFGAEDGKLNADMGGLIKLLGANMYASNIADVSVKELLQNAFDAVKGAIKVGLVKQGKIDIRVNSSDRTISVTDNARGMTPEIVKNAFFTVAGSDKSDLDPSERSGGLGLAKMGFMLGADTLTLDTVRDGMRTKVDTTAQDIANSNFKIQKTPAPKTAHGTTVTVKIPESYTDPKTGDQKTIWFPYSENGIDALQYPLVGPTEVTLTFDRGYGEPTTKVLPIGVNFDDKATPKLTTAHFSWGDAEIYYGVNRKEYPSHRVLSSGVYQFEKSFYINQNERIPYDIIINVKPNVDAKHPDYPFENSRERFKGRIDADIKSLQAYLAKVARGNEAADLQENFKGIVSMPRIEAGQELADASKKLRKAFDKRTGDDSQTSGELPELPTEINISDGVVTDTTGRELASTKPVDNAKESTFKADKDAPSSSDFLLDMKQDPKLPIFHNNTNVDYLEVGRAYGNPEQFFAELGTLMVEMKETLAKSGMWGYDGLSADNLFFGGISVDRQYGGVHIKVPYKAVLLNPFYDWGAKSLFGVRETMINTMIHEVAHQGNMDHGVGHNSHMVKVAQYLSDNGLTDYYRDALLDILVRHESTFTAMREAYGRSTTANTAKSLEDYGKSSSAASLGSNTNGASNPLRPVQAGGRQGRNGSVQTAGRSGQQRQVSEGIGSTGVASAHAERIAGPAGKRAITDLSQVWQTAKNYVKFLPDLVEDIREKLPSAPAFLRALNQLAMERSKLEQAAEDIAARALKLSSTARKAVNDFLADSTLAQKWGYDAKFESRSVKADPEMAKKFDALTPEQQQIVKDVFAHGEKMADLRAKVFKKLGLEKILIPNNRAMGPYAPLMRFGDWIVVLESNELKAARRAGDDKRVAALKDDPTHYLISAFDTKGQAREFIDAQSGYAPTDPRPKIQMSNEAFGLKQETLLKVMAAVKADDDLSSGVARQVTNMIRDMWLQTQSENAARMSGLKRMGRAGFEADMLRSFVHHARSEAGFIAHLEHGGKIHDTFNAMLKEVKDPNSDEHRAEKQDAFRIIADHYEEMLKPRDSVLDRLQDKATAFTTLYMLTSSIGYHVQNMTQTVHVQLPKLAADFNDYLGAWRHVLQGYKMVRNTVKLSASVRGGLTPMIDLTNVKDTGLREALEEAQLMRLLDVGLEENLRQFEQFRTGYKWLDNASGFVSDTFHKLYQVARTVEMTNRISGATAAYNMAVEHNHADPKAYMLRSLQQTQGDFSMEANPLILKKLPKVTGQYRKFQFMMAALYGRSFQQAFEGASKEEREMGRRFLAFKLFHTSVAAGVLGWPMMNMAAIAAAFIGGDDDEPYDFERWLYSQFDDKRTADLVLKGPLYAMGLGGAHTKLGEENVFALFPFVDFGGMTTREKFAAGVAGMVGGPALTTGGKLAESVGFFQKGDVYRGVENALPKGLTDAMAAFRYANEGYALRNGDIAVKPEEFSPWLLSDAIGLPSRDVANIKWTRGQQYEIEQFYKDRSSEIQRAYAKAHKNRDSAAMAEAREEWQKLQAGKDRVRPFFNDSKDALKKQPLSTLLKYPQTAQKRETKYQTYMSGAAD